MLCRLKRRPATVFLETSCTFPTAIVEQLHAHVFPDCMGSVEAHSIYCLDFHDPVTATASDS